LAEFQDQGKRRPDEPSVDSQRSGARRGAFPPTRDAGVPPASALDEASCGAERARIPDTQLARILVIDDNDDVRQMMTFALRAQGYTVEEAADAREAVRHLRAGAFDVILSDYELPDETGTSMLREAARSNLLGDATALIVTAHTYPEDAEGFEIIHKPVNLERLMIQVGRVLAQAGKTAPAPPRVTAAADGAPPAVDLILYVSAGSTASARARRSMESTLRGFSGCPIRYLVRDVAEEPARAEEDRVVFTPTLVTRGPGTRAWVLGDLADASVVVELLKICGLNRSA
jgi:CheY-like chemotaxis protein